MEGLHRLASPPPSCKNVDLKLWGETGNNRSSSSGTQGVCLPQLLLGLAPPRKQPPHQLKMFVFLGKGEGWIDCSLLSSKMDPS